MYSIMLHLHVLQRDKVTKVTKVGQTLQREAKRAFSIESGACLRKLHVRSSQH